MSKFSKALEQAERDRLLPQRKPQTEAAPGGFVPSEVGVASGASASARVPPAASPDPAMERERMGPASAHQGGWPQLLLPRHGDEPDSGAGVDDRLVSLLHPTAFEAEQYRALRHVVEKAHRATELSVVAVSSPTIGDGKTTTAINLAGALAQGQDARVLLIDADLRNPSVASRLGLVDRGGPTLAKLVLDPVLSLDDAQSRPPFNLTVIPAGARSPNSYELFKTPRLGELLTEARRRFDYVILDTPPLVHVLDARVLGRWVDGYVVVVACHRTPRRLLAEALSMMEPEKVLGLVFNGDDQPRNYYLPYGSASRPRRPGASRLARMLRDRRRGTR
jgi:capsular exopolysaccharide synthesis family protein